MIVKNLKDCSYGKVLDGTLLCELLHPRKGLKMNFSLAHAILQVGEASLPHRLKSVEVYYILEGKGLMHINNEAEMVKVGDTIYIPPKAVQCIENIGDSILSFLCIVSPPWQKEDEELC
ncbi:MAG TPA: cupin domain-containing protein [Methanobacteriales archaeon]|nr:MAG: Mannose-6-phosphate isomerase [Methanobacteriaceae archaeon 41_258]HIH61892.1 cupin domain-containing protein [Methanobacteriales archaeon]